MIEVKDGVRPCHSTFRRKI